MKHEFEQIRDMLAAEAQRMGYKQTRPFAITQKECAVFIEEVGSDQPVPKMGAIVEIMGVDCMVVPKIAHQDWQPEDTVVLI